ncbi:hypothetical protein BGZ60DRAFT_190787 [Tricladium varicosporioides]|nr:hypothetical protein BGZ60DRAFT_190787 [Hymenoscyphus varicosporioides]
MVCDDHRRRKITCNPDICPQNKQNHYKTPSMAVSRHLDLPHGREGLFEETRNPCNASDQETAVQIEQEKRQNESRQNSIAESSGRNSSATLTTPTDNPSDKASHLAGEEFEASLLQSSEQIYNFSEPLQHHHPSKPPTPLDPKSSDNLEDAGNTLGVKQDPNLSRPTTTTLLSPVVNHDSMSGLSSVQQKDIAAQSRISTLMNQNPLFNQNSFTINPTDLLPPGNAPQINYSNATNLVSSLTQSTSISPYQWHSPGLGFTSIPQVDNDNRFITPPPPMSPLQFQANPLSLDTPIADLHPEYFQYTFPDYDYTLYETLHPKSDEARGPLSSMDSPYSLSSDDMSTLSKPIVVPKSLSPVAPSLSLKHIQPMGSFSSDLTVSTQPSLSCGILSSMTTSENGQDGTELIPHCGDTMSLLSSSTSPTSIPSPAKIRLRPRRRGRPAKHRTISQENYSITSHMDNNNTIPSTPYEYTVLDAPLLMKYPSLMWKPSLGQQQTMRGDTRTHKENLDEATATTGLEAANQPRYTEQDSSPAQVGKYFSISGFNGKQYKKLDLEEAGDVPGLKNFGSLAIGSKVG